MQLVDAHLHLSDDAFIEDIDAVLQRACDAGLSVLVNVTTTEEELRRSFSYEEKNLPLRFCHVAGTPPQDAQESIDSHIRYFAQCARAGKLSAIGEVGLDYLCIQSEAEKARQQEVLRTYLELALETSLPLVVHCRGAFNDFFSILDQWYCREKTAVPGMLHCFTGTQEEAQELIARGWFVSISGIATFKNAADLREMFAQLPMEHLLLETDAPFLAPTPFRGKRNEPAYIAKTLEVIAGIKKLPVEACAEMFLQNTLRFLRIHG